MRTSNKNDAKGFNKLALLASAAATAAFVISQTRLMQRLAEPAAPATPVTPPDRDESAAERIPGTDDPTQRRFKLPDRAQATEESQETAALTTDDEDRRKSSNA